MYDRERAWLLREKYDGVETPEYFEDLRRLEAGEPLAYVIGHVPFLNTTIYLGPPASSVRRTGSRPLIPRSETEYWVGGAITEMRAEHTLRVLDLCAGSGCIGVSVLHALPDASVDFVEIDGNLHQTILKNVHENGINETRVRVFDGDLFEHIADQYDYILANPPYIDRKADTAERSVIEHEPHQALFGGRNGTEIIERIIMSAPEHLSERGVLYIEHEPSQAALIAETARAARLRNVETRPDQYDTLRYTRMSR